MKTTEQRLTELLDTNCGYSDEAPAQQIAEKLTSSGVIFADRIMAVIIKHGRYAAAKWAGHNDSRPYWEARYCGLQALYSDLTEFPDAYALFNQHCGVTFAGGHITAADGTTCID